jgi:hypothetical protein
MVSNPSGSNNASNPCTSLTLTRDTNDTATLAFGDTEYSFSFTFAMGQQWSIPRMYLSLSTFIDSRATYDPNDGDVIQYAGIEINISKVGYGSYPEYIVMLVKPTVQNYMASLNYTKVNIPLNHNVGVIIASSGLTNETRGRWYWFTYSLSQNNDPQLEIRDFSQLGLHHAEVDNDIIDVNIECRVFKVESQYMVIYVKPLY